MQRIGLCQAAEEGPRNLESGAVDLAANLESWIARDPGMLLHGHIIVGRQIQVEGTDNRSVIITFLDEE